MKGKGGEGGPPPERRRPAPPPPHRERTGPRQFTREVKAEMKKVAWPSRAEVMNSTVIVLVSVVFMTILIFGLDLAFAKGVLFLYE
jgi:preprotein translocase subunit SecE